MAQVERFGVTNTGKKRWYHYLLTTIFIIAFVIVGLALLFMVMYPKKTVVGVSMQPTYNANLAYGTNEEYEASEYKDIVYACRFQKGDRGDIIVYKHNDKELIKRIIAVAGDNFNIKYDDDGYYVFINGEKQAEDYILDRAGMNTAYTNFSTHKQDWEGITVNDDQSITIPDGMVFAMGDNRAHTTDSTVDGPVSKSNIIGKVAFSYEYNSNFWAYWWNRIFG